MIGRVLLAALGAATLAGPLRAQEGQSAAAHVAAGDSAFSADDAGRARREYERALALDPGNSRALFRLAQLHRGEPRTAVALLRRYVAREPGDAWGHLALGDALSRSGDTDAALAAYARAQRLAPGEADVHVGRARVLLAAGRVDAANAELEGWVRNRPDDVSAWRLLAEGRRRAGDVHGAIAADERALALAPDGATRRDLARLRRASATTLEPRAALSRDSDGSTAHTVGATLAASLPGAVQLTADVQHRALVSGFDTTVVIGRVRTVTMSGDVQRSIDAAGLQAAWRPTAAAFLDAALQAARIAPAGALAGRTATTGGVHARLRRDGSVAQLDLRASRTLLDATPQLVDNTVTRDEIAARADLPLGGILGLRAGTRVGTVHSSEDDNGRTIVSGGLVLRPSAGLELSLGGQQMRFAHASASGYFAARQATLAELGLYTELYPADALSLTIDAGAGAQRLERFDAPPDAWAPATRANVEALLGLSPDAALRATLDVYQSEGGLEASSTSGWRMTTASLGLRWRLR